VAEGLVRKPTNFISTICDETGEIHNYCGVPIDKVIKEIMELVELLDFYGLKKNYLNMREIL